MLAASRHPLVVLLAGDELTRSITTSCLEMSGYAVLGARTAGEVEALLLAQTGQRRVDVLVTDADVRDTVDGLSLAAVARCLDPAVGVVYTARSPRLLAPEAMVAGAHCLRTPYHGHQLVALVSELLASAQLDLARAELAQAELAQADLARSDLARSDLARPDLARPDLGRAAA